VKRLGLERCGGACATACVPSGLATSGVVATVVAKSYLRVVAVVVTWPLVRWDRPALEREVASPSVSCPRWEGQEEAAMDRMSTIVVKLEHKK
jgi:hypothetical protein